jgi:hypothetical protein
MNGRSQRRSSDNHWPGTAWTCVDALATWLSSNRAAASIFRSIIPDPRRSLCDHDHVRAFLLYRVYHVADVRFRIGTTVASTLVLLSCGTNFNTIGIFVPLTAEDETIEEELKILEQALAA